MKGRDLIKLIEADGWFIIRQKGSHKQYKHSEKKDWLILHFINKVMR